jgi:thioredoxin-like negative regulator of GroEL
VREWLKANAVAIQIDTDEEPKLAERYRVTGIPAVIAVRDGAEFDRSVGYKDPELFLAWAKDVVAGKRASDELLERSKSLRDSTDVDARYDLAQSLQRVRLYDEALVHYLWLWPATREVPSYAGVRHSFLLGNMAQLAKEHAPAKEAFAKILEELQARVQASESPEWQAWSEWRSFCRYFGERERVVAWYEAHRDGDGRLFASDPDSEVHARMIDDVFEALMEKERPLDAVRLYGDARERAERIRARYRTGQEADAVLDDEQRAMSERFQNDRLVKDLSKLYAALLAAERLPEAADVAAKLLETLDTPESRVGLVRAALDAGKTDEALARWLDEAEKAGADVRLQRKKLDKLLQAKQPAPDQGD